MANQKKRSLLFQERRHLDKENMGIIKERSQNNRRMKTIEKQLEAQSVAHFPYTHGQSFEDNRRTMQQDVKRAWDEQMKQSGRI